MKKKRNRMSGKVFGLLSMGVFLSALVVTMVGAAAEAVDILQEGLEKDGNWLRWAGSSFVIDTSTSKLGESSMKLTGPKKKKTNVYRYLLAKGDKDYEISFWYKTQGFSGKGPLRLNFNLTDLDAKWTFHRQYDVPVAKTDWTKHVEKLVLPFGKRVRIQFGFWMAGGEVWIDGLKFRELEKSSEKAEGVGYLGDMDNGVDILQERLEKNENWRTSRRGASFVIDTSTSKLGESSMKITGKGSVHRYLLAKGDTEYEISFWYKTKGLSGKNPLRIGLNSYDLDTLWLLHRQYDMPGAEKNTDWTQYVEKLVVPFKRTWLEFGFWMPGGEVWIDGLQFRELGKSSLHSSGMIR